jgi:GNAT superfamily N-acetyltransferase
VQIAYSPATAHKPGTIYELLCACYEDLLADDPNAWADEKQKWLAYDREIFANPQTVGACVFVTTLGGEAIGFASWDPRQGPELAVIGHSCIIPEHQGKGFGESQIAEVLSRLKAAGFRKALATTSEHPFFEPARRMYLTCGFRGARRRPGGPDPRYQVIDYEIVLRHADESASRDEEQ